MQPSNSTGQLLNSREKPHSPFPLPFTTLPTTREPSSDSIPHPVLSLTVLSFIRLPSLQVMPSPQLLIARTPSTLQFALAVMPSSHICVMVPLVTTVRD